MASVTIALDYDAGVADVPTELRLVDRPGTEATLHVDASPEAVWALVSDVTMPVRFSDELHEVRWLDGAERPAVAARFVGRNRHAAVGEWETTCTITRCDPPREFAWAVEDPDDPVADWGFSLTPDDGGTRLTQWVRFGTARSGLSPAIEAMPDKESKILHGRLGQLRANMERNLAGIAGELGAQDASATDQPS